MILLCRHDCRHCGDSFANLPRHRCTQYGAGIRDFGLRRGRLISSKFEESHRQHKGVAAQYEHNVDKADRHTDVAKFFETLNDDLFSVIVQLLEAHGGIRLSLRLIVDMVQTKTKHLEQNIPIGSPWVRITNEAFIKKQLLYSIGFIINSLNYFVQFGSDWTIQRINSLQFLVGQYSPLQGGQWFKTPPDLINKKGILNIEYKGSEKICFKLCVTASIYGDEMADKLAASGNRHSIKKDVIRVQRNRDMKNGYNYLDYFKSINFDGLECDESRGVNFDELESFEANNKDISVSVYEYVNKETKVLRLTDKVKVIHVDLFVRGPKEHGHFILIKKPNEFFGEMGVHRHLFCESCRKPFRSEKNN